MAKVDLYILILGSIILDALLGDPNILIHPVQIIGFWINAITKINLKILKSNRLITLGGLFILLSTLSISYLVGKFIELKFFNSNGNFLWGTLLLIGISSCLATKSLISSVLEISNLIETKCQDEKSKQFVIDKVQKIVSRDVSSLSKENLLRSATESLTENSVDGIFGPLFWILIGTVFIKHSIYLPGPLSLGFAYKALSTLDSMIGYTHLPFKYIGFFSAKLEDYATFIPCRVVVLTLPLVSKNIGEYFTLIQKSFKEGKKYESPNSGLSESIFAFIVNIKLGGENKYQDKIVFKPFLNIKGKNCNKKSIEQICTLIVRLKILWVSIFSLIYFII